MSFGTGELGGGLGQIPSFDVTQDMGKTPQDLQFRTDEGNRASNAQEMQNLLNAGGMKCPNPKCWFVINPTTVQNIKRSNGYFTCPSCNHSFNLMSELPWHGPDMGGDTGFTPGGTTRIGIPLQDQAQIGEDLVEKLHDIPGYGPITWWHPGGAISQSPLDGSTKDWGIEVKTLSMDDTHHRFIPGSPGIKADKNDQAQELGLKGVLGILVMLDFRRDVADIYVKEMPLGPWEYKKGQMTQGVATFRKNSGQKLIAEVPFVSPYKDPNNPSPRSYNSEEYYKTPGQEDPKQGMPF